MNLILTILSLSCVFLIVWIIYLHQKISAQSVADKLLLKSEQRFQSLLENIPNISVQGYNRDRRVIFWNEASEKLYGYSKKEALGQLIEDLIIPDEMKGVVIEATDNWMSGGEAIPAAELALKTKSGQLIDVYSSHVMQYDRNGNPEMYCIDIDLTARKQDGAALKLSERRARAIIDNSPTPLALHNTSQEIIFLNDAFTEQFGYVVEDIPTYIEWGSNVYPDQDYGHEIRTIWEERIERYISSGDKFESLEIKIRCKNGSFKTVLVNASLMADSLGAFNGEILISLYDITERKKLEEERALAAMMFKHTSEGMMASNTEKIITAVNPAFCELSGYSEDEVIGEPSLLLMSDRHDASFYIEMNQELDRIGRWQGEVWNKRKTGEDLLVWLTVNTIYNEDNTIKLRVGLFSDITERKQAETLALKQAYYDTLTSLPNRTMFHDRLGQEIRKSNRSNKPLALFFLDLDKFKDVNDTFGHPVGDKLLIEAAKRITDCVRDTDTVSRLGGDEFTVILSDLDDIHGIERIASNIIKSLSQQFQLDNNIIYISASIGITLYPNDANNVNDLLKNADQAMYFSKDSGRSRFSYFTPQMQESSLERFNLTRDLRVALAENQLELYYQPIIYLPTGKIHKAEALLRWKHPERGMVSPAEFIPLAEDSGLINEIGEWVFQQATQQAKVCQQYDADFQISINVSPVQFKEENDWSSVITQEYFAGSNVIIEITEGLLMEDNELIAEQLLNFRDAGIQVAIDDFGTGYSSLSYLNKFDIDYLKIDQSFIRNLTADSNEMALSEAIIIMAHKLGLKVIAEGVETEQQRDLLAAAGCDYVQGYLFSRPLPVDEFKALLNADNLAKT
ncbi:MAG: EAL domain-containing protein [Methylophaga sp.]|nr:EAL domain-containing protein [Methylophaga sp.]